MAVTRVGQEVVATGSSTAPNLTYPVGVADGDIAVLVYVYNHGGGDTSPDAGEGFTLLDEVTYSGSMRGRVYWRACDGTEGGSTLTISGAVLQKRALALVVLRGAEGTPVCAGAAESATDTVPAPGVSAATSSALLQFWLERNSSPSTTVTHPGGTTLIDAQFGTGGGACSIAVAEDLDAGSGTIGGGVWDPSAASGSATILFDIAFAEADGGEDPDPEPVDGEVTVVGQDTQVSSGTSTALDLTFPTGIQSGDLGLLHLTYSHDPGETTVPEGWDFLADHEFSSTMKSVLYYQYLDGTEDGAAINMTGPLTKRAGSVLVLRGAEGVPVVGDYSENQTGGIAAPTVDAGVTTSALVQFWGERSSSPSTSVTQPSGATLLDSAFATGGGAVSCAVAVDLDNATGIIGGGTWVPSADATACITFDVAVPVADGVAPVDPGWRFVEWDGTNEVELTLVEWDGSAQTALTVEEYTGTLPDLINATVYPSYVAHRGGAGTHPQNTIAAFEAYKDGWNIGWETDLQVLNDGTLALHHDPDLTFNGTPGTLVSSLSPAQWATVEIAWPPGFSGATTYAATLDQLLATAELNRILWIEPKAEASVTPLLTLLEDWNLRRRTVVTTFFLDRAQAFVAAGVHTCYMTNTPNLANIASEGIEFVGLEQGSLTTQIIDDAHAAGLKVMGYTINNATTGEAWIADGLDVLITNFPARYDAIMPG